MKKNLVSLLPICVLLLVACGEPEQIESVTVENETDQPGPMEYEQYAEDVSDDGLDILESLKGEYEYSEGDIKGILRIEDSQYSGYDISDYKSETLYRFLADSSNVTGIEDNKIYIQYSAQVYSDDTVDFDFYVLEYSSDYIDVYYSADAFEDVTYLYRATKVQTASLDFAALGISEYEYPAEFELGDNLQMALQAVGSYDQGQVQEEWWADWFVASYFQNSRCTFDYLEAISGDGQAVDADILEYVAYSLTGEELDFQEYLEANSVNLEQTSSKIYYDQMVEYQAEETANGDIMLTIVYDRFYDGQEDSAIKVQQVAEIKRNEYSCFDGYSIVSSTVEIAQQEISEGAHTLRGKDETEYALDAKGADGIFVLEDAYGEDGATYAHFLYLDLSMNSELAEYVREHSGEEIEVTYEYAVQSEGFITEVIPTAVIIVE